MNKKALCESIMKGVSKSLKYTLNEGEYFHNNELTELWDNMVQNNIATEQELQLITDINGCTEETLNDVLYARTGYHSWEQYESEIEY